MARRVFYSFQYKPDSWRASKVRNIGAIEGNQPATDNDWETVTKGEDPAIQKWIDGQLDGRSCTIVLIGSNTAGRKWINYEIIKSWNGGKGILGIHVHNLMDHDQKQSTKGVNPFDTITLKNGTVSMSSVVKAYDPPFWDSARVYGHIKDNLDMWIEQAIAIRTNC